MKINSIEMLLSNKNLKFKGDGPETVTNPNASLQEVPENEENSALNANAINNISFQGVASNLKKMGLNSLMALTLLGGAATAVSCSDGSEGGNTYVYDNTKVTTNITVNNYMTDEELVNAVLEEMKGLREDNKKQAEINQAILQELIRQGISIDRIMTLLEKMNMTAEDIFNMLAKNTENQDAILNQITQGNQELKQQLLQILNAVNQGNKLSADNNKTLTMILVEMGKANQNDKEAISVLKMMLAKINEGIQTNKAIAAKQHMLMQAVLGKLSMIDAHLKQGVMELLNKMDDISEANLTLLTKIFNAVEEGNENDKLTNELLTGIYNKADESIKQNHELTEKTHEMLWMVLDNLKYLSDDLKQAALDIIGHIDNASEANLKLLTKIYNSVNESNKNDMLTNEILIGVYNLVDKSIKQNQELTEKTHEMLWMLMDKLDGMNATVKQGILGVIKHIDKASAANINLLIKLINKVDAVDKNDNESAKILNQILVEIKTAIEQNKDVDAKTQAMLQSILDNIQNFNADLKSAVATVVAKMDQLSAENKILLGDILNNVQNFNNDLKTGFAAVIGKMDKMSAEQRAFYNTILRKIDKLDQNAQRGLGILIHQMAQNNAISAAMLNKLNTIIAKLDYANKNDRIFYNQAIALMSELLGKVDALGGKSDAILDAIANITLNSDVDLSKIEKMLADLLAQEKANGNVLTSIDGKMNFIAVTLEGIKTAVEQLGGDNKKILAKLDEILKKIPEGCKCDASLQVIIEKLDKIVEEIKKGNNHEGILDDLDNMFKE